MPKDDFIAQAKAHMQEHRWAEALPLLNAQLYRHANDPWAALLLGTCYYQLNEAVKAMGCFKLAEQNLTDHPLPLCSQGDVLMMMGEVDQAGAIYRHTLAKFPESELARQSLKWWQEESAKQREIEAIAPDEN